MIIKNYFRDPIKHVFLALAQRNYLDLLPDKIFLKLFYFSLFKKPLNLKKPRTFSEKLQWLKLYDRKPEYTTMVDKYEVKKYVADRIGEQYVIPTLGVWNSFDEIDFDLLPDQFVLKCTHDSGGLVICRDKRTLNINTAKEKIEKSLKRNFYLMHREWPYKNVKPRIIAEMYMQDETQKAGLVDYKFYCFNGEPKFLYVSIGLEDHATATITFMNLDWTFAPFKRTDFAMLPEVPPKPDTYDQMLQTARKLSEGIPFLRVDLYEIQGRMYFSELTFSPCAGFMEFSPAEYDKIVGEMLTLPKN